MTFLIKTAGFMLVIAASTATGFYMSSRLEKRAKMLLKISICLTEIKERIRLSGGEIFRILHDTFDGKNIIELQKDTVTVLDCGIKKDDKRILEEYFSHVGMSDTESECNRTELYISLLSKQQNEAEKNVSELSKLYRTLGFMAGLFGCIFLL